MNPNCTEAVKSPTAVDCKLKALAKSPMIPFPANHNEVQQNCEKTIMGRMCFFEVKFESIQETNVL